MIFTTEDGRPVHVGMAYKKTIIPRYPTSTVMQTQMWLKCVARDGSKIEIDVHVTCSPYDNFSRKVGRTMARQKFIQEFEYARWHGEKQRYDKFRDMFTREERRKIYSVIMPEFHAKQKQKQKAVVTKSAASKIKSSVESTMYPVLTRTEYNTLMKVLRNAEACSK